MAVVIIITGPCGAGKTVTANLVAERFDIPCLHGDDIKEELFPSLTNICEHPNKLKKVEEEIFKRTKDFFEKDQNVVVDYIVLGEYAKQYQSEFGNNLIIKVLLPTMDVLIERDEHRNDWTAGKNHISRQYSQFNEDKGLIGNQNFIDNSDESMEEIINKHFADF